MKKTSNTDNNNGLTMGICIGVAIGTSLGVVFDITEVSHSTVLYGLLRQLSELASEH